MVNGINSSVNSLEVLRATNAFKNAIKSSPRLNEVLEKPVSEKIQEKNTFENVSLQKKESPIIARNRQYVEEVKNFAKTQGNQINDEDIEYALRYGRSILVDHVV